MGLRAEEGGESESLSVMGRIGVEPSGRIRPRDIAFFHGVLDMKKLSLAEKLIVKGIKAPVGDFRDWDAITSWATAMADVLKKEVW